MGILVRFSEGFQKQYRDLTAKEQKQFDRKYALFVENQFHPSLRSKHLRGHKNLFEFSVNMNIRVIWRYEEEGIVLYLAIGKHDILKRY